jgi:serine protease Do
MRTAELFDNYLQHKLSTEQQLEFEQRLSSDEAFAKAFGEHKLMLELLDKNEERTLLRKTLKTIHNQEFGKEAKIVPLKKEGPFLRYGKTVAMVAGVGFVAVLSTLLLLSTGGYLLKQQSNEITDLKRDIVELKYSQDAIVKGITNAGEKKVRYAPANYEGTGFALNNKGYVITSWHMVNGADSIFIENSKTERSSTKIIFSDPKTDIAVLKIENPDMIKNWQVPFSFNSKPSDIGEKVFTLGYPRKEVVYGEGSLSALSGYRNDTVMYQVSIPVNPGNSGGPLLDEQGNVIGLVRGKITSAEATSFAIKSIEILKSIKASATDSTKDELSINTKRNMLKGIKRSEQIKRINPYVFNVMVYKSN